MRSPWKKPARVILLAAVYFLGARLGLSLAPVEGFAALVWPPSGISLAALFLWGSGLWPGVFLGALAVNLSVGAPWLSAAGIGAGNALEAVLAAHLLRRAGFRPSLEGMRDALSLIGRGALLPPLVAATVGAASLWAGGAFPASSLLRVWGAWWVGDALGVLLLAPLLFAWNGPAPSTFLSRRLEAAVAGVSLLAVTVTVFGSSWVTSSFGFQACYLVFPPLLWAAFRFGPRGASTAVVAAAFVAVTGTVRGLGPFAAAPLSEGLMALQLFMALAGGTALLLSSTVESGRKAEDRFFLMADNIREVFYMIDPDTSRMLYVSPACEEVWGRTRRSLYEDPRAFREAVVVEDFPRVAQALDRQRGGQATDEEYRIVRADGSVRRVRDRAFPVRDAGGRVSCVTGIAEDVTDRRRAETRLWQSEERYRAFVEQSSEGIWRFELDRPVPVSASEDDQVDMIYRYAFVAECNDVMARMRGFSQAGDVLGARLAEVMFRSDPRNVEMLRSFIRAGYRLTEADSRGTDRDGKPRHFLNNLLGIVEEGHLRRAWVIQRDDTERRLAEERLRASLGDKETLLKEIHHRVKNNLQIVYSIVNLQARHVRDRETREELHSCRDRVKAMSLVHEKLYRSKDLAWIDFAEYVRDLARSLMYVHGDGDRIRMRVEAESAHLGMDEAVPCGLIVHELVSNSLKHAFPGGRSGEIVVSFRREEGSRLSLKVKDDGVGFVGPSRGGTLGLELVENLVRQIGGKMERKEGSGTEFHVSFHAVPSMVSL